MYLKRKIDKWLKKWKDNKNHLPALIVGVRQCGKTKSIKEFGKNNYKSYVYINFWNNSDCISFFEKSLEVDDVINNIALYFSNIEIKPFETLLIFDEIQECPRARLFLKNIAIDKRYDVIASGSYLGINGYVINDSTPIPTGYEDIFQMKTMDFEEFLWANNYKEEQIKQLESYFSKKEKVPTPIHEKMKKLFNQYVCIGGFPNAVSTFVETHNLSVSCKIVNDIMLDLKNDFGRRINKDGNFTFKTSEVARIQSAFDLIPTFLVKENKRFITSKILNGSSLSKYNAIEYLKQTGIVCPVYNLEIPSLPLLVHKKSAQFKLFPADIGIFSSMMGNETIRAINNGDLGQGKGAIYEAAVFDSLYKEAIDVFYYAKDTGLEIDFVICYDGKAYLVEAKSKSGNTKSAKTIMNNPNHYGKTSLLKIGDYNVGMENDIITIPHYMTFLLKRNDDLIVEDLSLK